jgi:hypothetical protein
MKRASTHFLRFALFVMAAIVLALCMFALPSMWRGASAEFPYATAAVSGIVVILGLSAIPFFVALWRANTLLGNIDRNAAFSEGSVDALRSIKRCAIVIAVLLWINVPLLFPIAEIDDAPGLVLFGAAFACAPIVVAVFAAILQKLIQNAIDIKSENDLTV